MSVGCKMSQTKIQVLAQEWLRLDQDNETRSKIEMLLEQQNYAELESRLCTRLTFGTAGLRAQMGAGYPFINSLTIIQTSQGLAAYLLKEGVASGGIVVGYDARHNSEKFARLAAAVFTAKGLRVWWYEDLVHTPMVPFGVNELGAAAGIMITASHNPAQDNGYKVYGSNGCQINTPVDSHIAASIMENLEPITWDIEKGASLRTSILGSMKAKYFQKLSAFVGYPDRYMRSAPFVYTPMHGVGNSYLTEIMTRLENPSMTVVPEQAKPDPDFPTVRYPNPEESGALDRATTLADERGIRLVIANDPDADRFAVAEKIDGHWRQFTGDQVGALFTYYLVKSKGSKSAFRKGDVKSDDNEWVLTTAVSSQMISVMAENDFSVGETLTGFKWLGNRIIDLEKQGKITHFAYEEALGYMFPDIVRDKDGITAAVIFLCACAEWGSPWAKMQELYQQFGYFETMNTYWRSSDLETTAEVFKRVRALGTPYPTSVVGRKVLRWRDLTIGYDSGTEDAIPDLPSSSSSQMITCWLQGNLKDRGIRFTIRASGTEPKIKIYLECQSKDPENASKGAAEALKFVALEWFNDPRLAIEQKYQHLL